jgi:hypothetical protein
MYTRPRPNAYGEPNQTTFVRWVDSYLLPGSPIRCDALDIYAARCGVVHTFTPNSRLYRDGKARRIGYTWGTAQADDLHRTAIALGSKDRSVHIDQLVSSFRRGVAKHLDHVEKDAAAMERFQKGTGMWFADIDRRMVDEFLETVDAP